MSRILAICALTLRTSVRSRLLLVLLVLLLAAVAGLPLSVRGDGTVEGLVQVTVAYTLGAAGLLATLAAIWAGCAAVSAEIAGRQLHLVMSKPVSATELWLGKWLGLLALNACLLAVAGTSMYGLLRWQTRAARWPAKDRDRIREEVLTARAVLRPVEPGIAAEARALRKERIGAGEHPDAVPGLRELERSILARKRIVPAGGRREFIFDLPFAPPVDRPMHLEIRLLKSSFDFSAIRGRWTAGPSAEVRRFEKEVSIQPVARHALVLPAHVTDGGRRLVLGFDNLDPDGMSILFDPEGGLELLVWRGAFPANLLRVLFVLFGQLAFVSAIGLSAGSLFSLPVASFVAVTVVGLIRAGGFIAGIADEGVVFYDLEQAGAGQALFERALRGLFAGLAALVRPLRPPDVLGALAGGRRIPWGVVGAALGVQAALYPAILATATVTLFRRRELGLPVEGA
jgi:hypothetical protein